MDSKQDNLYLLSGSESNLPHPAIVPLILILFVVCKIILEI